MRITRIEAPAEYPITVQDAKAHLMIADDITDHDLKIQGLIAAATEEAELFAARKFVTQKHKLLLDAWPCDAREIKLPYAALQSVESITYTDFEATQSTLATTEYVVATNGENIGRVVLGYGKSWPADTLTVADAIEISFTCGFGAASAVPDLIKHGLKMVVEGLFEYTGPMTPINGAAYEVKVNQRFFSPWAVHI